MQCYTPSLLFRTLVERMPNVAVHGCRVMACCAILSDRLCPDPIDRRNLSLAARLHDVGTLLHHESGQGCSIAGAHLATLAGAAPEVASAIRFHREPWSKNGGESTPLLSRILAVADAYDRAAARFRQYPAWSAAPRAVRLVAEQRGLELDPMVIDVLQATPAAKLEGLSQLFTSASGRLSD